MKKFALFLTLLALPLWGSAQVDPSSPVSMNGSQISVSAKGTDVRGVLHDLFTQANKNYVLENVPRIELFLSLNSVDFDETLEIVCRIANLRYEIQNGIYYLSKIRPTNAAASRESTTNGSTSTAVTSGAVPPVPVKLVGKLSESVLKRTVSGRFAKQDLREIVKRLGDQAKVAVEIDERIPKYKLDFTLNTTSLGFALKAIAEKLDLEMVFTESQSLRLQPKTPKPAVEKLEISTD